MDPPKGNGRRLMRELVSQCRVSDRFLQRSHMLHCVHEASVRSYQEREASISTALIPFSGLGSPGKQYGKAGDSSVVSPAEAPLGEAQWPYCRGSYQ
jgi:hypothetical protein